MLTKLENEVFRFLKQLQTQNNLQVLVCVSGGSDSMALLHILKTLRDHPPAQKKLSLKIAAAHFNHERRGAESEADQVLVEHATALWNIPLATRRWSTAHKSTVEKGNFHDHARRWRYAMATQILGEVFGDTSADTWIFTAHHARDNVESLLLNIIRGAGVEGLQGISRTDTERRLARPLLHVKYEELRQYVQKARVPFRDDESNSSTEYSRNLVRQRILPVLAEINPNFEDAFSRLAHSAQNVLAEIHVPDNALPLGEGMSTTQILKLAKKCGSDLAGTVTSDVLNNILHHVRLASRRRPPVPERNIPLANGWIARISDEGLRFVKAPP